MSYIYNPLRSINTYLLEEDEVDEPLLLGVEAALGLLETGVVLAGEVLGLEAEGEEAAGVLAALPEEDEAPTTAIPLGQVVVEPGYKQVSAP